MLIDLSYPLSHGQGVYPGDPPVVFERAATLASDQYNVTRISMGSHSGTHLDAPAHFFAGGRTVDQIELARFYGRARLIDLAPGGALAPGTPLTVQMLQAHAGAFSPGARVIYRTGWERRFASPDFFDNPPSLTLEAAKWIAERRIGLLGMDTPTPGGDLEVHRVLLQPAVEVVILESLANLDLLPAHFTLMALPLKIAGGDGAPVRAVAQVP